MKHKHGNRILGRTANHRTQLLRNLTAALLTHDSIVTTEAKAKELRRFFEPLLTKAKQELTIARRRQLLRGGVKKTDITRLHELALRLKARPGGYLRLTKLPRERQDGSQMTRVDILE